MKKYKCIFIYLLLFSSYTNAKPTISKTVLTDTQLIEWKLTENNFELQLVQRLPDQTRSFFEARGFPKNITNQLATSCIFQTIIKNNSTNNKQSIHVDLNDWRIQINGESKKIQLKETWNARWNKKEVSQSARLAFRWATFPSEQNFEPSGDYNWGMISFGPKPGEKFNLLVNWKTNQKTYSAWIKNIVCPDDR